MYVHTGVGTAGPVVALTMDWSADAIMNAAVDVVVNAENNSIDGFIPCQPPVYLLIQCPEQCEFFHPDAPLVVVTHCRLTYTAFPGLHPGYFQVLRVYE
jgi:hypothetical protein